MKKPVQRLWHILGTGLEREFCDLERLTVSPLLRRIGFELEIGLLTSSIFVN